MKDKFRLIKDESGMTVEESGMTVEEARAKIFELLSNTEVDKVEVLEGILWELIESHRVTERPTYIEEYFSE